MALYRHVVQLRVVNEPVQLREVEDPLLRFVEGPLEFVLR